METIMGKMLTGEFQLQQSVNNALAGVASSLDWAKIVEQDSTQQMLGTCAALKLAGITNNIKL